MHALPKTRGDFCDFKHYVGYRISKIRGIYGMSQVELADATGLSVASISAYERGDTMPLFDSAYEIASALHTDVNDLCGFGEADDAGR